MPLNRLRLLQVGDVHYPDVQASRLIDSKDPGFPTRVRDKVAPDPLGIVLSEILTLHQMDAIDGVLICGDLTSRGDLAGYSECVDRLSDSLGLADRNPWDEDAVHAVPGNHDVNRALCDPKGADLMVKFRPLQDAWTGIGLPVLAADGIRATRIPGPDSGVAVCSVNSCIGCGETRYLPGPIQTQLKAVLDAYVAGGPADAFSLVGERLDTPAFAVADLTQLRDAIRALPITVQPVVLSHHNLLPQSLLRVDLYTELLNSGQARSHLMSLDRPLIYCHGHIHANPVEIIQDARKPCGRIIAVSAPELSHGFNIITCISNPNWLPLGCEIRCYGVTDSGHVEERDLLRVSLACRGKLEAYNQGRVRDVVANVHEKWDRIDELRDRIKKEAGTAISRPALIDAIQEAYWLDCVEIHDVAADPRHWQVRRKGP